MKEALVVNCTWHRQVLHRILTAKDGTAAGYGLFRHHMILLWLWNLCGSLLLLGLGVHGLRCATISQLEFLDVSRQMRIHLHTAQQQSLPSR